MISDMSGKEAEHMEEPKQTGSQEKEQEPKSPDWATEALEEMDEFIESQGIYIRQ
jgi:hypothetical protein